jgi:putative ABC transport system ATP-binding protein
MVLGPNGSGKSTLLHAIVGELDGTVEGDIQVLGRSVLREPWHQRARTIAMVHQDPTRGTAAHLTLREHCGLTMRTSGRSPVAWEQVAMSLSSLGATLQPRQLAGELSGGQRQVFTLVLAVLSAPKILLLDEPTSALDSRHTELAMQVISEFSGQHTATIMVTHDLIEAQKAGNRLLILKANGEVFSLFEEKAKGELDERALREILAEASISAWTKRLNLETPKAQ